MMRKTNEGRSPAGTLLPSVAAGLVVTFVFMLAGAVLLHRGILPEYAVAPSALAFLAAGGSSAALLRQNARRGVG